MNFSHKIFSFCKKRHCIEFTAQQAKNIKNYATFRSRPTGSKYSIGPSQTFKILWKIQDKRVLSKQFQKMKRYFNYFRNRKHFMYGMPFFGTSLVFLSENLPEVKALDPQLYLDQIREWKDLLQERICINLFFGIYELFCTILRSCQIFIIYSPIFALYPITYFGSYFEHLWWRILLIGIECSGPIFIKFGQWASTRRDLFPEACCNQFSRLQRRTKPHSWHFTKKQLSRAFGKNWKKLFVKFDNNCNPIGSGCVAQVYKVWMSEEQISQKDIGDEFAVEDDDNFSFLEDGLEAFGFGNWIQSLWSDANESSEECHKTDFSSRDRKKHLKQEEIPKFLDSPFREKKEYLMQKEAIPEFLDSSSKDREEHLKQEKDIPKSSSSLMELSLELAREILCRKVEGGANTTCGNDSHSLEENLHFLTGLTLKQTNELQRLVPVALKVLHPGVSAQLKRDTMIFRSVASFLSYICPPLQWLALEQCAEEFLTVMESQVDLKKEADNMERFIEAFSHVDTVRFPRPVRPFVTKRVIVETFEEGEPMLNFLEKNKPDVVKKNLAQIGVDALLKMIFRDNFVHGDMHPGNMLVQNESTFLQNNTNNNADNAVQLPMVDIDCDTIEVDGPKPLRICILDCGIVAHLKLKDLKNFRAVFQQVILGRGDSVADLFLKNSIHSCKNEDLFRSDMKELVQSARCNALSLEQVDVGALLQQLLELLLKHRVRLESAFSSVVLSVFILEGLGRSLDPHMDILERARPLLFS